MLPLRALSLSLIGGGRDSDHAGVSAESRKNPITDSTTEPPPAYLLLESGLQRLTANSCTLPCGLHAVPPQPINATFF